MIHWILALLSLAFQQPAISNIDGVVTLDVFGREGHLIGTGTAFQIEQDKLVTARHVLLGAERVCVNLGSDGTVDTVVLADDSERDIAVLGAKLPAGTSVMRVSTEHVEPGAAVSLIRNSDGKLERLEGVVIMQRTHPLYGRRVMTSCRGQPGDSGSPLLDSSGAVVGIVRGGINTPKEWQSQATPSFHLEVLTAPRHEQSVRDWNTANGTDSSETWVLWKRVRASTIAGNEEDAIQGLLEIVHARPADVEAWHNLFALCVQAKDEDRTDRVLHDCRAAGIRPDLVELMTAKKLLLAADYKSAIPILEKCRDLRMDATVLALLATARGESGDSHGAEGDFRAAAELDATDPYPWDGLTLMYLKQKRYLDAIASAKTWSKLEWSDRATLALGAALQGSGDNDGAMVAMEESVRRNPKSVQALRWLGWFHGSRDQFQRAVEPLSAAAQLQPNDHAIGLELAYALSNAKRYVEARALLEKLSNHEDSVVGALKVLAIIGEKEGDRDAMLAALERLRKQNPFEYNRFKKELGE